MKDDTLEFKEQGITNVKKQGRNQELLDISKDWMHKTLDCQYIYNFTWMGLPIIQMPQDIMAMQEIIFDVKPDLIIEAGVARGGSVAFYASMIALLNNGGEVVGIDLDLRAHNRKAIEASDVYKHMTLIDGSSTDPETFKKVEEIAKRHKKILVVLDSNHAHDHVLKELQLYSDLVSLNSYLVVFDLVYEDLKEEFFKEKPFGPGDSPKTALDEFLKTEDRFIKDTYYTDKLLLTCVQDGFLKKVK